MFNKDFSAGFRVCGEGGKKEQEASRGRRSGLFAGLFGLFDMRIDSVRFESKTGKSNVMKFGQKINCKNESIKSYLSYTMRYSEEVDLDDVLDGEDGEGDDNDESEGFNEKKKMKNKWAVRENKENDEGQGLDEKKNDQGVEMLEMKKKNMKRKIRFYGDVVLQRKSRKCGGNLSISSKDFKTGVNFDGDSSHFYSTINFATSNRSFKILVDNI